MAPIGESRTDASAAARPLIYEPQPVASGMAWGRSTDIEKGLGKLTSCGRSIPRSFLYAAMGTAVWRGRSATDESPLPLICTTEGNVNDRKPALRSTPCTTSLEAQLAGRLGDRCGDLCHWSSFGSHERMRAVAPPMAAVPSISKGRRASYAGASFRPAAPASRTAGSQRVKREPSPGRL